MVEIKKFHCKCRFEIVKMAIKNLRDLHLYPIVDQRQMKMIDVKYNVRVGYWASKTNM